MAKLYKGKKVSESPKAVRAVNRIAYLYTALMLGLFPLYYRNNYINIMESKWLFFMSATLMAAALTGIWLIAEMLTKKTPGEHAAGLYLPDIFLALLMLAVSISWMGTIRIDYFYEAWSGSQGKMAGVFMYLVLALCYVMVSRFLKLDKRLISIYLWVNLIVFSLAVLNHFMIDPLHMYVNLVESQYWMFCSTMGNINVLAGYFCVFVPVTIVMFCFSESRTEEISLGIIMTVSFMGVVAANGDAGILGVLGSAAFILWFCFESYEKLFKFFLSGFLFFAGAAVIGGLDNKYSGTVKEILETVPAFVSNSAFNRVCMLLCLALAGVSLGLHMRKNSSKALRIVRNSLYIIAGVSGAIVLAAFIYLSAVNTEINLGQWETYLRFSDNWGSSRGFTWKRVLMIFTEHYSLFQKLFGFGPDLMVVPLHTYYNDEIFAKMGAYLVDAHSETFQTLGTLGLSGVIGYHGFQLSALVRAVKNRKKEPFLLAAAAGMVGYIIQGMMGSPQTFSTPVLFIMIAIAESVIRRSVGQGTAE